MQEGQIFQQRYRIGREIGRGSFGIVYIADDLESGGVVAIKVLLPWVRHDEGLRHRLKREAKLTQMLSSPHAVRIRDLDETPDGDLFIVMEYLDGEELSKLMHREGRLRPERAADIGRQALHALGEAHRLGVIHRDLKPQNIFVGQSGSGRDFAKLLDFGIAKVAGTDDGSGVRETTRLTRPGNVLGTPAYMSPEQCQGESLTPASDFYSLGVVMYEMLTGRPPFDDMNQVQILVMHAVQPPPPLPAAVASLPVGRAIMRALSKDPQERFGTAEEFSAAIAGRSIDSLEMERLKATAAATAQGQSAAPSTQPERPGSPQADRTPGEKARTAAGGGIGALVRRFWLPLVIVVLLAALGASLLLFK
jgi:serine/threonine-protein kinase